MKMWFAILLSSVAAVSSIQSVTLEQNGINQAALANNKFALKLHKTFVVQGNAFFSPISVFVSLGMLHAGARGRTREEIRQALSYHEAGLGATNIGRYLKSLLRSLSGTSGNETLKIANALIFEQRFPPSTRYKNFVKKYYNAMVKEADIENNPDETVVEINDWVKNKTEGKITELIESLDNDTVLVLLNTIYFYGSWEIPFEPSSTRESRFYNDGNEEVLVPTMVMVEYHLHGKFPEYGFEAIKLPYVGDKFSMMVLLPLERNGVRTVEKDLSITTLDDIVSRLETKYVVIHLPRFKLENTRDLKQSLVALGMRRAFTNLANFRTINRVVPLQVSKVVHSAVVDVTEYGTEASGATYTGVSGRSYEERTYFSVDHPFLFFIRHEATGAILFFGRVCQL